MVSLSKQTLPAVPQARRPRGMVKLEGTAVDGWVSFEVDTTAYYQASTFQVVFVVSRLPKTRNATWFFQQRKIACEILAGFQSGNMVNEAELKTLIYGYVDDVSFDPVAGTISVSGRDLVSVFVDTKVKKPSQKNMTAAALVSSIAGGHGILALTVPSLKMVGTSYEIDKVILSNEETEWDFLVRLAKRENYALYMNGKILNFEPVSKGIVPYILQWVPPNTQKASPTFNGQSLSFSRNMALLGGVQVVMESFNQKQQKKFQETYPKTVERTGKEPRVYQYTVPNKTPEELEKMAQAQYQAIVNHEVNLSATLPADHVLSCNQVLRVVGTGTAFDQEYRPDKIVRRMDFGQGYTMQISAKGKAPGTPL
jgi:phage protein D